MSNEIDWLKVCEDPVVVLVAKQLASDFDGRPVTEDLEPGNTPFPNGTEIIDGRMRGGPAFFRWRQFVAQAKQITDIVRSGGV